MSEPAAKLSGEMSVVAKAAGVGDLADGLACVQQPPAMQLTRGMIQTDRTFYVVQQGIASVVRRRRAKGTCGDPSAPVSALTIAGMINCMPQRPDSRLKGRGNP
jgi:hypothetical protein